MYPTAAGARSGRGLRLALLAVAVLCYSLLTGLVGLVLTMGIGHVVGDRTWRAPLQFLAALAVALGAGGGGAWILLRDSLVMGFGPGQDSVPTGR